LLIHIHRTANSLVQIFHTLNTVKQPQVSLPSPPPPSTASSRARTHRLCEHLVHLSPITHSHSPIQSHAIGSRGTSAAVARAFEHI
jgi:hypothetical protein